MMGKDIKLFVENYCIMKSGNNWNSQGSKWDGMRRYGTYRHFFGRFEIIPPLLSSRLQYR